MECLVCGGFMSYLSVSFPVSECALRFDAYKQSIEILAVRCRKLQVVCTATREIAGSCGPYPSRSPPKTSETCATPKSCRTKPGLSQARRPTLTMDLHEAQNTLARLLDDANAQFHKMPGSAIILRYIKSSYQNDPVRSAIELFLFLFAVRYMLSPSYSTQKKVKLTEEVCLRG